MATRSRDLSDEILSKLDIRAEYEKLGVKIAAKQPNANGWLGCFAYGRDDNNQSAAINIHTGCYTDRGSGFVASLFDFAVHAGSCKDWKDARKHYATVVGMEKSLPRKDSTNPKRLADRIDIQPGWNPLAVRGMIAAYPGVTALSLQMADCKLAMWPKGSREAEHVIAMPIYGPHLTDAPPVGYIITSSSGRLLKTKSGEQKRLVIESTGLVNRRGLAMIGDGRAKLIIKVEGFSDVLAAQASVSAFEDGRLLDHIAIISNACGSTETTLPEQVAPVFAGIPMVVIHDADKPGQDGAQLWTDACGKVTKIVNTQLPYQIEEKHGKDLRDWLNEGRNFGDLLDLIEQQFPEFIDYRQFQERKINGHVRHAGHEVITGNPLDLDLEVPLESNAVLGNQPQNGHQVPATIHANVQAPRVSVHQQILKRLGMIALGTPEGTNDVVGFCTRNGRTFTLSRIASLKMVDLVIHLGDEITKEINVGPEPDPTKLGMPAIQLAIAAEGSRNRLTGSSYFGVGIWDVGNRLLLVNSGEATIVNGEVSRTTVPIIENRIFDFGENKKWFEHSWFVDEFAKHSDRKYSMSVLNEAIDVFARWDNWKHSKTPEMIAALVCCTWIQNVWEWRPQVAIVGATNSGKTMLIRTLRAMFANGEMAVGGMSPSAAGIRQKLKSTSKGVFIDEFEPHSKHRKECLEMFRGMSRGDSAPRGTANQKGQDFVLKHLPWHGAIAADMQSAADRNRYLMVELLPVKQGRGSTLQLPSAEECSLIGLKLMTLAVKHWVRAKELAASIKKSPIEGVDRRLVESFAVPCGMISAILDLTDAESVALTRDVVSEQDLAEQSESDEQTLLKDIFESPVQLEGGKRVTVSMLVKRDGGSGYGADEAMIRSGIRRITKNGEDCLFFVESSICQNLFTDASKRNTGVAQVLSRIEGATKDRQRMGAHNPRGVTIPITVIERMLGIAEGDEDSQKQSNFDYSGGSKESSVVF